MRRQGHTGAPEPRRKLGLAGTGDRADLAELMVAAADGDTEAWDVLLKRFSGLVWSIARVYRLGPADAADVSQVVWLRLLENLGRIRQPDNVGSWLASVTRHECLRIVQRSDREMATPDDIGSAQGDCAEDVDRRLWADECTTALHQAFDTLPPRWRMLLKVLMADPAPCYEEVAAALVMPIGSIGPTRQRSLDRLRHCPELAALACA